MFNMKARYIILLLICVPFLFTNYSYAQKNITGVIRDNATNLPLSGVLVSTFKSYTTSDADGNFTLNFWSDTVILSFNLIGFQQLQKVFYPQPGQPLIIMMQPSLNQLDAAVISGNRSEVALKKQTVSTDIIKPYIIENRITANMENLVQQLPSVNVIDGQLNIRSGSGWTYGAGSRVQVLVDDVPLITGDAGQVQWKFIPTDNIVSIEVIKGASSVMYGSGSLNGVINIRTATPGKKGKFQMNLFNGIYSKPEREIARWWTGEQWYNGANGFYSKRWNRFDFTTGFNILNDKGYRLGEYDQRFRVNTKTNYRFARIPLYAGIDASIMSQRSASFLLWESFDLGYIALDSAKTETRATLYSIDPHADFQYGMAKIRYRGRFYGVDNNINETTPGVNQDNSSLNAYNELVTHIFLNRSKNQSGNQSTLAIGSSYSYTQSNSPLYGNRQIEAENTAGFMQLDYFYKRLTLNAGIRYEAFKIDKKSDDQWVGRFGLTYELTKSTFIRASIGQGYRYPTIAEKYIETSVGLINIFPNVNLEPEQSTGGEIGIKQAVKLGNWIGYFDVAYFYTHYKNMIEFNFGQWRARSFANPIFPIDLRNFGFTSFNIGEARIDGIDITHQSGISLRKWQFLFIAGYTFTNPVMLEPNKVFANDSSNRRLPYSYNFTSTDTTGNPLKYRFQHLFKIDVQATWNKKWMLGVSLRYNSRIENIDRVFVTPPLTLQVPGIEQGNQLNNSGDWITDIRIGYQYKPFVLSLVINNLFNHEMMTRPADFRPTRLTIVQLTYKIN